MAEPTNTWTCPCGQAMARFQGQGDQSCSNCDQEFNAGGQRLRSNWRDNVSTSDEEVSDLQGYELAEIASDNQLDRL